MAKKDEDNMQEKVNQPDGAPLAPGEQVVTPGRDVLVHEWQKGSPAISTNAASGFQNENIIQKLAAAEEAEGKEPEDKEPEEVDKGEYEARTKLDVSDKNYINPSLGHHVKK